MRRIGCLVFLILALIAGWLLRDKWGRGSARLGDTAVARTDDPWESLTPEGAARARTALDRLARPTGPGYATLRAGELASFVLQGLRAQLPPSIDSLEAAAIGERLYVRGRVKLSEIGAEKVLGGLAALLGERERIQFGGTFRIIRPGLAEFQVKELKLRDFPIPTTAIPRLLRQIERGSRPEGVSPDGLPLVVPAYISDVRLADRQVTLYKTTP
jgi:hypothetical protein